MIVGLYERDTPPDLILFADTGGEYEETYAFLDVFDDWLAERKMPRVTRISNADREEAPHSSLEQECLTNGTLPSLAFGFKGCSAKWKRQPMDRYLAAWAPAKEAWANGEKVTRLIGIDYEEQHRSAELCSQEHKRWIYRRPLIDWVWGRDECREAVERVGLEAPRKSACWFCPATKKHEVLALAAERTELFERAVGMEHNAQSRGGLKTVRGLGRSWSWEALVEADKAQLKLFPEAVEEACGCYDGSDD